MPADPDRSIVLVANRGPISYHLDDDGTPVPRRGAGGLVSGLAPLMAGTDALWIAAALSDGDRAAARDAGGPTHTHDLHVQLLDLDPALLGPSYDVICNGTLWFVHHHLYDLAHRPRFDHHWHQAWEAYRVVNQQFADAVADAAPPDSVVLVQDYHLCLLPAQLRAQRDDVRIVHFSHTPFAAAEMLAVLPDAPRRELLEGMAGADACGFHSNRWANGFRASCAADDVAAPATFAAPLATDAEDLRGVARSAACDAALERLQALLGERQLIARVDRIELSKNLLRGFDAYERLLELDPSLHERVVFGAFLYPSREGLAEYLAYRQEVERRVDALNRRWGTDQWAPVHLEIGDDFPASVAALRRYDVLLVNPVRDGLNLVASEGPLVNERDGALLLSRNAGAADVLGEVADIIQPFDIEDTATKLRAALNRSPAERATRARTLVAVAGSRSPADWMAAQLDAARNAQA